MKITISVRNVDGNETIYPACKSSLFFCRLAGTKTITQEMMRLILAQGYEVEVEASPAIRRNLGYWDGVAARERNRLPEWNKIAIYRCRHPFDRQYGEGFWIGWYGEEPPKGAVIAS